MYKLVIQYNVIYCLVIPLVVNKFILSDILLNEKLIVIQHNV